MLTTEMEKQGNILFRNRSYFPIVFIALGILAFVQIQLQIKSGIHKEIPFNYELLCLGVALFGFLLRIIIVGYTPENTSGRNTTEGQIADVLNTTGMYSMVRHPLYVGNFFMWFGVTMYTANPWFIFGFIFMYWVYYERIMHAEEQFLFKKFGDSYKKWASEIPAFIPSTKNYVKSNLPFSMKKVLKKEKVGLLNTFLVFFVFSVLGTKIQGGEYFENKFWLYGTIASIVIYVILKSLKMFTNIFEEEGR